MFTRLNKTAANAHRYTQKGGRAFRIKMNAIMKKAVKERKKALKERQKAVKKRDMTKALNRCLLTELIDTEEKCLELKKRVDMIDKFAMPILLLASAVVTAFVNMIPQY